MNRLRAVLARLLSGPDPDAAGRPVAPARAVRACSALQAAQSAWAEGVVAEAARRLDR